MTSTQDLSINKTHLFSLHEVALLDITAGLKTTGTETLLRELLTYLIDEALTPDMLALQEAYTKQDWAQIQQLAHKIKGGATYIGTIRLKIACQYLEHYSKIRDEELLEPLYQQVFTVIHDTIETVSTWLSQEPMTG